MIRLFVETPLVASVACELSENQTHYLRNVMRVKPQDHLLLFNGRDGEWHAEILEIKKKYIDLRVTRKMREQDVVPDVWLCFAPVKNVRLDFIVQKATELGVAVLQPVMTERTVVRHIRVDKMHLNAIEAAEQCERLDVPECREPLSLQQVLANWDESRALIHCDETGQGEMILSALELSGNRKAAILIGPEGGFSPQEIADIQQCKQAVPVSLGGRILRADTAALAALSCWQAACGDWYKPPQFAREL